MKGRHRNPSTLTKDCYVLLERINEETIAKNLSKCKNIESSRQSPVDGVIDSIGQKKKEFDYMSLPSNEEDDADERDDNEDDKETVIFDLEFNTEIQNETDTTSKDKSHNQEVVTVLDKQKPTEHTKIHNVNDEYFTEICTLVKRLHELYRIISQLKTEIPKNRELAVHFVSVIKTQTENFHREIRNSQKSIIKYFEKMLVQFTSAEKVALEISKRTFLSPDDVINVLSKCLLVEGAGNTENIPKESENNRCRSKNAEEFCHILNQIAPSIPCYRSNPVINYYPLPVRRIEPQTPRFPLSAYQYETQRYVQNFHNSIPKPQMVYNFNVHPYTRSFPTPVYYPQPVRHLTQFVPERTNTYYIPSEPPPVYSNRQYREKQSSRLDMHPNTPRYNAGFNQTNLSQPMEVPTSNLNSAVTNRKDTPETVKFDPTVPQKLTMKNHRLEAGPVLESKQVETVQKEKPNLSRTYVCAQADCKEPGVRICKRCESVIYCSETCQLKNWTQKHKKECFQLKQLRG